MRKKMVPNRVFYIFLMLLTLTILSCEHGLNRQMDKWGHMMGFGYGGEYIWLFVLVLISVVVFFLFRVSKSKGFSGSIIETPFDILKRRYAKGDIDKEEFKRRKKDLQAQRTIQPANSDFTIRK